MFSIWDVINLFWCLYITIIVSKTFKFSDKVILILVFHVFLIFFIDLIFNPSYWGDQLRYYVAAIKYRAGEFSPEIGTVAAASRIMTFFPLFIDSYKSIGFGNYLLYLFMYTFILTKLQNQITIRIFKIVFLTFPSMTLYSCLGLRDFIILFMMFFMLYLLFWRRNWLLMGILWYLTFGIKGQNALLYIFTLALFVFESVPSKKIRNGLYLIFIGVLYIAYSKFVDVLLFYRQAMYIEDTRMIATPPDWTPLDLYRYFFAPFFFDARNAMQILQSFENAFMVWLSIQIFKLRKIYKDVRVARVVDNFFIISGVMYSYVVFNYGTITRYKFPFFICWILINIIMIDKLISKKSCASTNEIII